MEKSLLRVKNLTKHYQESGFTLYIPELEFEEGKIYGLVGPNGAGKTTLLNLLSLLDKPDGGKIFFREEKIEISSPPLNIRRRMHMVMENPLLFQTTVFKNLILGLKIRSVKRKLWPEKVKEALQLVGLEGFEKRYAPTLSRGEAQRVVMARALVIRPEVLFLDEPFTNMDRKNVDLMEKLIKTFNHRYGATIIFTTHDLLQAYRLADEVITLLEGRLVEGSLENLFTGEVREENGLKFVKISPSLKVWVTGPRRGKVHLSIPPQDIILSHQPLNSSARNSFKGMVKKIQLEGEVVRVWVKVAEEVEFSVLITRISLKRLNLSVGSPVFLTFKVAVVRVF